MASLSRLTAAAWSPSSASRWASARSASDTYDAGTAPARQASGATAPARSSSRVTTTPASASPGPAHTRTASTAATTAPTPTTTRRSARAATDGVMAAEGQHLDQKQPRTCRRDERKYYRRGRFWSVFEQLPHCRRVLAKGQTAGTRPLSRLHGKANRASGAPSLAGDVVEGAADVSGER